MPAFCAQCTTYAVILLRKWLKIKVRSFNTEFQRWELAEFEKFLAKFEVKESDVRVLKEDSHKIGEGDVSKCYGVHETLLELSLTPVFVRADIT